MPAPITGSPRSTWGPGTLKLREPRLQSGIPKIPKTKPPRIIQGLKGPGRFKPMAAAVPLRSLVRAGVPR